MSGHVRTKSADFAISRTMVRVLASQRMSMHSMRVYWCLWMSRHHIQLTQGQGHARSRFIGASSRSISSLQIAVFFFFCEFECQYMIAKSKPDVIFGLRAYEYAIFDPPCVKVIRGHPRSSEATDLG